MRRMKVAFAGACAGLLSAGFLIGKPAAAAPANGWSIQTTPNPPGATASVLNAVSCSAATACTAVGGAWLGPSPSSLAERWNGSAWAIQPTPTPHGSTVSELNGVSCPGRALCLAVGFAIVGAHNTVRGLSERWDGSRWTIIPIAVPAKASWLELGSVSCVSVTSCTAVGSYFVGLRQSQPMAEGWNGTVWTLETMPNPHAQNGSGATAVACTAATACTATAEYAYADVNQSIYALQWNGSRWTRVNQPNPGGQSANYDMSVSCSTASACTAVGYWTNIGTLALAERWDGTTWQRQGVPQPAGSRQSTFGGVSCPGVTACMAAGTNNVSNTSTLTLAERWNGTGWSIVSTPNPSGAEFSAFSSVWCASPTSCVAVGNSYNSSTKTTTTLAEVYSG